MPIRRLPNAGLLPTPSYKSEGASGIDLQAALVGFGDEVTIEPGQMKNVPTGLCVEIPAGYEGQVRSRSGLAKQYGIAVAQGIGTIDSDFRGEIQVMLRNFGDKPVTFVHGDRIAQLIIAPVVQVYLREVEWLTETERGDKGFGSSGL